MLIGDKPHSMKPGVEQPDDISLRTLMSFSLPVQRKRQCLAEIMYMKSTTIYFSSAWKRELRRTAADFSFLCQLQVRRAAIASSKVRLSSLSVFSSQPQCAGKHLSCAINL